MDTDDDDKCLGTFMRLRVKYDVSKSLRRSAKLTLDHKLPPVRVLLRYEKLPDYCYICGLLGHQLKSCHMKNYDLEYNDFKYPYVLWLRAEDAKVYAPPVELLFTSSSSISTSFSNADTIFSHLLCK